MESGDAPSHEGESPDISSLRLETVLCGNTDARNTVASRLTFEFPVLEGPVIEGPLACSVFVDESSSLS